MKVLHFPLPLSFTRDRFLGQVLRASGIVLFCGALSLFPLTPFSIASAEDAEPEELTIELPQIFQEALAKSQGLDLGSPEFARALEEYKSVGPEKSYTQIRPPVIKAIASSLDITPDSPLMKRYVAEKLKQGPLLARPPRSTGKVLRHLRLKEGEPLPSREEIEKAFQPKPIDPYQVVDSEPYRKALEDSRERIASLPEMTMTLPPLPSCEDGSAKVNAEEIEEHGGDKLSKDTFTDYLFIKGPMPMDPAEAFGVNTIVHRYVPGERDYLSSLMVDLGAKCLPFRVRSTASHVLILKGVPALKNYDNSPQGKLNEAIKRRLNEYR